ncbi:MAG: hypothetical protein KAH54_12180, partial [Candidatus Sabulitectum sp.]|nr:hypothetical protein [Candidatus Sabulitectum sp.]
ASYSLHGYGFLYNVVTWNLPAPSEPALGEEINIEGFETDLLGEIPIVFWEDDLEGGVLLPDSVPLYTDFGSASKSMVWMHTSSGAGEINNLTDLSLEMHRTVTGAFDRNIAGTTVDLSAYSTLSDELYLTVQTWKGNVEWIDAKDGVFLNRLPIALAAENFEAAPYDVTFWEDTGGRHRIHSPSWGGNSTKFVTLDNQPGTMTYQRSRMLIELDTSTLPDGTPIVVNYRMADHQDATDNFSSIDNSGDYIGWSFGSGISDTVEGYEDLNPSLYADGVWYDRTYTFTPSGSMPSALYIICSHYGNDIAVTAFEYDGISFDDITVSAADFERVGTPVDAAGWQNIAVDLDDAAQNYGIPFSSGFGIALSQYGQGPWSSNYGMHWRYFELGVIKQTFSIPGWHHAPVVAGENDDWLLENVAGDYKWTLHANNPSYYSNLTNCYLETPEITIPTGAVDAQLSFEHSVNFETGYDYGWIEISTDGGTTWNVFETSSYNDTYGGHGAYTGFISNSTVDLDLVSHIGLTVQLRFVFKSDDLIVAAGWTLDDFVASGSYSGVVINSIGFKPTMVGGGWFFNDVDVYLGSTTEEFFPGDGEWDKTNLTFLGTYGVGATMDEWVIINLIDDYSLLASANLIVKIEMAQTGPAPGFEWVTALHPGMARREVSSSADPTMLLAVDQRPAFMIGTDDCGQKFVDGDSTGFTE